MYISYIFKISTTHKSIVTNALTPAETDQEKSNNDQNWMRLTISIDLTQKQPEMHEVATHRCGHWWYGAKAPSPQYPHFFL